MNVPMSNVLELKKFYSNRDLILEKALGKHFEAPLKFFLILLNPNSVTSYLLGEKCSV